MKLARMMCTRCDCESLHSDGKCVLCGARNTAYFRSLYGKRKPTTFDRVNARARQSAVRNARLSSGRS